MIQNNRQRATHNIPESKPIDANNLFPGLWIGSKPPRGPSLARARFTLCVFCAKEIQPKTSGYYPGVNILAAPLRDDTPTDKEKMIAIGAAKFVSNWLRSGNGNVLVTCHMGLNRSALVCALTWKMMYPRRRMTMIIHDIREKRDQYALCNQDFVEFLKEND